MQFNGWTFVLEIVNFLVLVWLLHRLLYRPVLAVIARRRAEIDRQMSEADAARQQAEKLKSEYDQRLEGWAQERNAARRTLDEELEHERQHRLELLRQELVAERARDAMLAKREVEQARDAAETEALALAARFVSRLLSALAGPELEARLIDRVRTELGQLPDERQQALRDGLSQLQGPLHVSSAYPLTADQQSAVTQALAAIAGGPLPAIHFDEDPTLLAGLRIQLAAWRLSANLQDDLKAFTEMVRSDA